MAGKRKHPNPFLPLPKRVKSKKQFKAFRGEIGRRIARGRIAMGLTQRELADCCGYTINVIGSIENGRSVSMFAIFLACGVLGIKWQVLTRDL